MTERRTQAYAVRRADTALAYHTWRRCSPRFLAAIVAGLGLLGAPVPGQAEDVRAPDLVVEVAAEIDAPPEEVRATLLELDRYGEWFPNTVEWEVLERGPDSAVAYGRLSLPWPVDDRDYVVRYAWSDADPPPFRLHAEVAPEVGPGPREDVVRVEDMTTTWEVAPLGSTTRVRYVYTGSPGGMLPDWVFKIGWEMQTGILMDALEEQIERRRAASSGTVSSDASEGRAPRPHD